MAGTHEFFTKQHEHLNKLETSVAKTKSDLEKARNATSEKLREKRADADATRRSFESKVSEPIKRMQTSIESRKQETKEQIEEWKRNREVDKLERRAERMESYAEAAMDVVDSAQQEAAAATIDAIEARLQAEEARQMAGAKR